jgi:hypothetical protein
MSEPKQQQAPSGGFFAAIGERAQRNSRFVATGEFRCPKRGEWYLSGALIEAYRAHADLSMPYWIARKA